jgi:hypothetical protein
MSKWPPNLLLNPLVDLAQTDMVTFIFDDSLHRLLFLLLLNLLSKHLPQFTPNSVFRQLICDNFVLF